MSKAILVFDMPNSCRECPCCHCTEYDTFWELCREHIIPTIYPRTAHTFSHCFYCMDHLGDFTFVTEDAAKEALEKEEVDKDVRRV